MYPSQQIRPVNRTIDCVLGYLASTLREVRAPPVRRRSRACGPPHRWYRGAVYIMGVHVCVWPTVDRPRPRGGVRTVQSRREVVRSSRRLLVST